MEDVSTFLQEGEQAIYMDHTESFVVCFKVLFRHWHKATEENKYKLLQYGSTHMT